MPELLRPDASCISNYVADRGPAKYFHGRQRVMGNFKKLVNDSLKESSGTIFLIQGAPGAGKTALLDQCGKLAKRDGWKSAVINIPALWDPDVLLHCLGKGDGLQFKGSSGTLGFEAGIKASATVEVSAKHVPTIMKILQDDSKPLLLILDEAQVLGIEDVVKSDHKGTVTSVLDYIHNGRLNKPVILLMGGLGITSKALRSLGISRYKGGCFVELGALGKKSECAVIKDWLVKEGRAEGDPNPWVDAIAQKTCGWPQHITAYAEAAAKQIRKDKGNMTPQGLESVNRTGLERREMYYRQRADDFDGDQMISLSEAIAGIDSGMPFNKELVVSSLKKMYTANEAKDLFNKFLIKGLIAADGLLYSVPIPSMHHWMKTELTRTKEKLQVLHKTKMVH